MGQQDARKGWGSLGEKQQGWPGLNDPARFCEFTGAEICQSVAARFEQQVAKYGQRSAIRCGGLELTYSDLNASANAIARNIVAHEGSSNTPIVLFLGQGVIEIAAVLGCFKAGKICVPLPRNCEQSRAVEIVADTGAQLVISDGTNYPRARSAAAGKCLVLNLDEAELSARTDDLGLQISADNFAYILYTSGSTGQPKGVVQSQRNLLHDLRGYTNCFHITAADRVTLFAPCSGAQGMKTALSALVNGATLCLWDVASQGLAALATWLVAEGVTIFISAPTVFRGFTDLLSGPEDLSNIRLIKLGSEPLLAEDIERYKRHFSTGTVLVNWYSSTESGNISYKFISHDSPVHGSVVELGRAHADKLIFLRDEVGHAIGFDEIGEIAVKSQYMPLGYWRRGELTATKYLADPDGGAERICLTGDLAIMRADGSLEYRGRKDSKVNIRGFSLDLSDVEVALRAHPAVKDAVVATVGASAEQRLIAYIVCAGISAPTTSDLRGFLRKRLFEPMIPTGFVFVESLPLTANGKVDRRALPRPSAERPLLDSPYLAPESPSQRKLTAIWEKVLGIHPIGVKDSFLDLGGNSLLAVRLVSEIGVAFKKNLVPSLLFQAPTIEAFAKLVGRDSSPWSPLMPIQPGGSKKPFFWIHGDSSGAYLAHYLGDNQPLYGLEHQSQDGKAARYTYVESIAAKYFQEIRTVQAEGPYYIGGYSFGAIVAFEIAQQLTDQEDRVDLLVLLDPPEPPIAASRSSKPVTDGETPRQAGLSERLRRHRENLAGRGHREMLNYLRTRILGTIGNFNNAYHSFVTRALKKVLARACLLLGRDLPPSVRSRYILDIYHRARLKYRMRPYGGRVVLFKGDGRSVDYLENWRHYLGGETLLYEIPGSHLDLRQGSFIHHWAEILKTCLNLVQDAEQSADDSK